MTTAEPPGADQRMREELGGRIAALRKSRSMTLVVLAAKAKLSQPFLSQIERGRARPSMPSLHRIAAALGTTTPALLSDTGANPEDDSPSGNGRVSLVRVNEGRMVSQVDGQAKSLVFGARAMYPMEFVTQVTEFEDFYEHTGEEFMYVISGQLEVDLADDGLFMLGPGDTLYFGGGVRHRWRTVGAWPARVLVTQAQPIAATANISEMHI